VIKLEGRRGGIPHLAKNERDTRIPCTRFHPVQRVRLFLKESRKKVANSTKLNRKSGVWGTRELLEGKAHRRSLRCGRDDKI
jgi:hypothetical protein